MKSLLKKAGLGVAVAATTLMATAPAQAEDYHGRHRGGDATGAAIVAGVAGLAIGAAIASNASHRHEYHDRRGYYNQGYYHDDYYYRNRQYYPQPHYYAHYRDDYRPRCYTERRYDPYYGRTVKFRVCR
ncbi:MAG: hypothetical protein WC803_11300 [Sphingomonas sp.]